MATLSEIREQTRSQVVEHWKLCEESGLQHTNANRDDVLAVLDRLYDGLAGIAGRGDEAALNDLLRTTYGDLDRINEACDGMLLETDERELLVPIIVGGVEAAGFDPAAFPDGEPGGEFRNF